MSPRDYAELADLIEDFLVLEPFQGERLAQEILLHTRETLTTAGVGLPEEIKSQYHAFALPTVIERRMYDSGIRLGELSKGEEHLAIALASALGFSSIANVSGRIALRRICKETEKAVLLLAPSSAWLRECEWQEDHLRSRLARAKRERLVEPTRSRTSLLAS